MTQLHHHARGHTLGHAPPPHRPTHEPEAAGRLARRAASASVVSAILLIALKGWAAAETGSVAVLASLADSGLDLLASLITLGGVRWASQPADEDHRFGHGKAEALAAIAQVVIILGSAVFILQSAVTRLMEPAVPASAELGIGVSLIAIVATVILLRIQSAAIKASGSIAIQTDRMHYASDLAVNLAVIAALVLDAAVGVRGADAVFGIGIGLYLALGAVRSGGHAIDILMDREWPDPEVRALEAAAAADPAVESVHDVRTRGRGLHRFAQLHIWVDPAMSVAAAHDVVDGVEARVGAAFPGIELIVHVDPAGHYDPRPGPAKRA